MKKFSEVLALILITLAVLSGLVAWFWGFPFLIHLAFEQYSYTLLATIWLSIHLVTNLVQRLVLSNKLSKYKQIDDVLKGVKNRGN